MLAGFVAGYGSAEFARIPAAKTYFVHRMVLERPVGSAVVSSGIYAYELTTLPDGGVVTSQVEGVPGFLSPGQQTSANQLMDAFTPK